MTWTIELSSDDVLDSLFGEISQKQIQYIRDHALRRLKENGLNLLGTNHAKALSGGLYELRVRRDPELMVRIFFTLIHPSRLVIVGGYNKKRDPSDLKQRREIKAARRVIDELNGRS
jgi:phage-related protein